MACHVFSALEAGSRARGRKTFAIYYQIAEICAVCAVALNERHRRYLIDMVCVVCGSHDSDTVALKSDTVEYLDLPNFLMFMVHEKCSAEFIEDVYYVHGKLMLMWLVLADIPQELRLYIGSIIYSATRGQCGQWQIRGGVMLTYSDFFLKKNIDRTTIQR